ncbi:hypothetical protein DOT_6286 [Desulfosporosinus sp. OT]|nr:hypothetical protein DOT_6286 [Desulfosporosinus sp. OT]
MTVSGVWFLVCVFTYEFNIYGKMDESAKKVQRERCCS